MKNKNELGKARFISPSAPSSIGRWRTGVLFAPLLLFFLHPGYTQEPGPGRRIDGRVTDPSNLPLAGVSVVEQGTSNGTVTDRDGHYTLLRVADGAILHFQFLGMQPVEMKVGGNSTINVTLEEQATGIDEVIVVGYGTQRRGNITGAVSSIGNRELVDAPVASASSLLGGKLPGLVSVQQSGQPGADAAALNIRGFDSALIIVDGIETNFNNIDPNQIESVSILKDGSASIYGSRAGNGVILVTTKRGQTGKPVITLNSSFTMQGNTAFPTPVSSGQYAEMAREEWVNRGSVGIEPFTEEQIRKYYEGGDPQYPDTDWIDELTRKWVPQHQHNISVRGGNDRIRYFGLVGFLDQRTMWTESDAFYKRYNVQSNIDAKILDNLTLQIDINARVEDRNFTARDWSQELWQCLWTSLPTVPVSFPDPTKIPNVQNGGVAGANLVTNRDIWGYNDTDAENYSGSISLKYDFIHVPGLSVKVFGNYSKNYNVAKYFQKSFTLYDYDYASGIYTENGKKSDVELNIRDDHSKMLTGQLSLTYDKKIGDHHRINVLALMEGIDSDNTWLRGFRKGYLTTAIDQLYAGSTEGMIADGSAGEMGRLSYVGRLNYSYKNRYLLETTLRADASARFAKDQRWGYFPSVSVGWRVSEEKFMGKIHWLDQLKLRLSYGQSGNDAVGMFQYLSGYSFQDTYVFQGSTVEQGIRSTGLANPNLTWEEMTIYNAGLDFQLFNRKLYGELDLFYRERTGIPATRQATLPNSFGASLPQENLNSQNNRGFELMLGTSGSKGELTWDISGNVSWSRAKWDHFEEPEYTDPDQKRINRQSGQWTDRIFGYRTDGLFTSKEQIENLGFDQDQNGNTSLRPGDVRFVNVNGDGVLDWKDQVELGSGTRPNWMAGLTGNFAYRNFDLSLFFQGAFGHNVAVNMNPQDFVSPTYRYDLRWTEQNNDPNAKVPRLGGSGLNGNLSDYILKKSSYARLKRISFGYTLPEAWTRKIGMQRLRVYVAGTNLLTFKHRDMRDFDMDPEMPSGRTGLYYPQQKTISFGINLSL